MYHIGIARVHIYIAAHNERMVQHMCGYVMPLPFLCVTTKSSVLIPVGQPLSVFYRVIFVRVGCDGLSGGCPTAGEASATEESWLARGPHCRLREIDTGHRRPHPPTTLAPLLVAW